MSSLLEYLSYPLISLSAVQITGLLILVASLDNGKEILARSGTYFDYNPFMIKHLVAHNNDQLLGVFTITLPTILQASKTPFWISYFILIIALILRFSPIRKIRIENRTNKIIKNYKVKND